MPTDHCRILPVIPKSAAPMLTACLEPLCEVLGALPTELRELRLLVDERAEVGRDDTVDREGTDNKEKG